MKKIAKYFFAALATMAAMSCVKELNVEKPVELTGKAYEFTATIGDETKTTLDAETMTPMWLGDRSGNEYITVMEPNNLNTYVAEGIYEPTAEVTFVMAEDGGKGLTGKSVFAVSPAEAAVNCFNNADSVGVTVNYNQIQYAYPETYDPAGPVAVAYNADVEANPHFSFKNASALLKFRVMEGSQEVTSVKFYSLGGEPLAGQMTLMEKGDSSMIVPAKGASNWVEIRGLYESPLDQDVDYYIAVAPALLKKGVGFQFNDGTHVETFTIEKEINIERNKIYDLGLLYYESNVDDKWYLVGNTESNGVGTFSSMMFQAEGNNLVARNVTFAEKQSFRILNPAKKVSYYANAAGELEADTWIDLTEDASYAYYPEKKGTYDVYVDYVDGVITGVALVTPGEEAPEYLVPEGYYTWTDNSYGSSFRKAIDIDLDAAEIRIGTWYSDFMAGYEEDLLDPTLIDKYILDNECYNVKVVPTNATSGMYLMESLVQPNPMMGGEPYVAYFVIEYSDVTPETISLYSAYSSTGDNVPVLDENGDPVGSWEDYDWDGEPDTFEPAYYDYLAISIEVDTEDFYGFVPVTATLSEESLDIAGAVPTEGQRFGWMYEAGEYGEDGYVQYTKVIDLGATENGTIIIAGNYDQMTMDMETYEPGDWANPEYAGKWIIQNRFDKFEIVPTTSATGEIRIYNEVELEDGKTDMEYYLIYYSSYTYKFMISLHSPAEILDEEGNPIPVQGTNKYWKGLGIEQMNWMTGNMGPVAMQEVSLQFPDMEMVEGNPDGAQWFFVWEDMMSAPAVLDFGVTLEGQFGLAYDAAAIYGEENLPEEMLGKYAWYLGWDYSIKAKDATSGEIMVTSVDHFGDIVESSIASYTDYTGSSMIVNSEFLYLDNVTMFIGQPVSVFVENNGGTATAQ